jgi:hypothetical protein
MVQGDKGGGMFWLLQTKGVEYITTQWSTNNHFQQADAH